MILICYWGVDVIQDDGVRIVGHVFALALMKMSRKLKTKNDRPTPDYKSAAGRRKKETKIDFNYMKFSQKLTEKTAKFGLKAFQTSTRSNHGSKSSI